MSDIEEMFKQFLEREAVKEAAEAKKAEDAAKAERESQFVSKADLEAAFSAFGESLGAKIAEQVEKAMPVARPEGAGRQGESTPAEDPREANPVAYIAKKAAADRTDEDKALAWELTKSAIWFAE